MEEIAGMKVYTLAEIPDPDTGYMRPWKIDLLYEIEPQLKGVAERAAAHKRRRIRAKLEAYEQAKNEARGLVGWYARDPRLRSSGAWDCFFKHVLRGLRL